MCDPVVGGGHLWKGNPSGGMMCQPCGGGVLRGSGEGG